MTPYRALLSAIFATVSPFAIAGEFETRLDAAHGLQQVGDYQAAERTLISVLANLPAQDRRRGIVLHELGSVYHSQGRVAEAELRYKAALAFWPQSSGPAAGQRLRCTLSLAALYLETGAYALAERLDLAGFEKDFPPGARLSPEWAKLSTAVGALAWAKGQYEEAERYYRQAVATWESLAPNSIEIVQALSNLAVFYSHVARVDDALVTSNRALKIAEMVMAPAHPERAILLANVASLYSALYGPARSEPYFEAALRIGERTLGPEHPIVGRILLEYSTVLKRLKRKAEARECYKRASAILSSASAAAPRRHTVHVNDLAQAATLH